MFTIILIILNTVFWFVLHFGIAYITLAIPENVQNKLFDSNRTFYKVSESQMRFYKKIKLPLWKDKLPQYNVDFDKRHLSFHITDEYLDKFIFITCRAEIIHISIALLGYLSLLFTLLCENKAENFILFFIIATIIGLCNIPFCMIQRYNRKRLISLKTRIDAV